jgi:hypothetical protein
LAPLHQFIRIQDFFAISAFTICGLNKDGWGAAYLCFLVEGVLFAVGRIKIENQYARRVGRRETRRLFCGGRSKIEECSANTKTLISTGSCLAISRFHSASTK